MARADGSTTTVRARLAGAAVALVGIAVLASGLLAKAPALEAVAVNPAEGAVIDGAQRSVWVSFRGADQVRQFHLAVSPGTGGAPVRTTAARMTGQQLVTTVPALSAGDYLLGYHVELADGRQLSGVSRFSVAAGGAPPPAEVPVDGSGDAAASAHNHTSRDPLTGVLLLVNLVLIGLVAVLFLRRRPSARSE